MPPEPRYSLSSPLAGGQLDLKLFESASGGRARGGVSTFVHGDRRDLKLLVSLQGTESQAWDFTLELTSSLETGAPERSLFERDPLPLLELHYSGLISQAHAQGFGLPGEPQERRLEPAFTYGQTRLQPFGGVAWVPSTLSGGYDGVDFTSYMGDVLATLLRRHGVTLNDGSSEELLHWLQHPPRVTSPGELLVQLVHPTKMLKNPELLWVEEQKSSKRLAERYKRSEALLLVSRLLAVNHLRLRKKLSPEALATPLKNFNPLDHVGWDTVTPGFPRAFTEEGQESINDLPLGTKTFIHKLMSLPLEDVFRLLGDHPLSADLSGATAVAYVDSFLQARRPEVSAENAFRMAADLMAVRDDVEGEQITRVLRSTTEKLQLLGPCSYALLRHLADNPQLGPTNLKEMTALVTGLHWLRGASGVGYERNVAEAVLSNLLHVMDEGRVIRVLREVVASDQELTDTQWTAYARRYHDVFEDMPANMWLRLI